MTPREFIFEYLQADQDTGAGSYEKMVSCIETINWEEVKLYILKMRYFYFLRTSYWFIISSEVKRRAGWKCPCGGRENLQVHHTDSGNDFHGSEHILLAGGETRGLICLCGKCHDKIHVPSVKRAEKKRQRNNRKEKIVIQLPYYPERISESEITGSSSVLIRKMLEELEHERKVMIDRTLYEGWKIQRV